MSQQSWSSDPLQLSSSLAVTLFPPQPLGAYSGWFQVLVAVTLVALDSFTVPCDRSRPGIPFFSKEPFFSGGKWSLEPTFQVPGYPLLWVGHCPPLGEQTALGRPEVLWGHADLPNLGRARPYSNPE